jgi:hypothetical protein
LDPNQLNNPPDPNSEQRHIKSPGCKRKIKDLKPNLTELLLGHKHVNLLESEAVLLKSEVEVPHPEDVVVIQDELSFLVAMGLYVYIGKYAPSPGGGVTISVDATLGMRAYEREEQSGPRKRNH